MSNNLKIGVLFSAYNCASYIDECMEPWLKLKKELNLFKQIQRAWTLTL